MRKFFRFSIRRQLVLISIAVLSLPYVAYDYVREMETFLREGLEISLAGDASRFAGLMSSEQAAFPSYDVLSQRSLFVHPLNQVIQLDGYTDDWTDRLQWAEDFYPENASLPLEMQNQVRVLLGARDESLYLLFDVVDDAVVYQSPAAPFALQGDQIHLSFHDQHGDRQQWRFVPAGPGQVRAYEQGLVWDESIWEPKPVVRHLTNVQAVWEPYQEAERSGYRLEIRVPENVFYSDLGFQMIDVDQTISSESPDQIRLQNNHSTIDSFAPDKPDQLNRLIRTSDELDRVLSGQTITAGRRVWVLDAAGNVLATRGSLRNPDRRQAVNRFYRLILPAVNDRFSDDLQGASRLKGEEVAQALSGEAALRWRSSVDNQAAIVSAAQPIRANKQIIGAILVEETTGNLQMVQRQALAKLFTKTLLVFAFVTGLLLLFSARLSQRIRRLSRDARKAIDANGRVKATQVGKPWRDELGDLAGQYSTMLERLHSHHDYLENLASKLSHELRTPMAVVQSSLENLYQADQEELPVYLARAQEGMARLERLTVRLSEAANLDHALQSAEKVSVDLLALLEQLHDSYQQAYSDQAFALRVPERVDTLQTHRVISPDLFVQMLDKLISNAIDFAETNTPITLALDANESGVVISIENIGPSIDEKLLSETRLPEQFLSQRVELKPSDQNKTQTTSQDTSTHLGMGLYIAARIARFHGGTLTARNSGTEVHLLVSLPREED